MVLRYRSEEAELVPKELMSSEQDSFVNSQFKLSIVDADIEICLSCIGIRGWGYKESGEGFWRG